MSASLDLKSKEEKDAELDKRIEALRRKNQALIKRYQEIEEDRKKAEQEGIAVTGVHRHPRSAEGEGPERQRGELDTPTLTVQVLLSPEEKRLVSSDRKSFRPSPATARGSVRGAPYPGPRSPRAEGPPEQPRWEGASPDGPGASKRGGGRGAHGQRARGRGGPAGDAGPDRRSKEWEERRRQNIEKMNEEMEKIAEYERSQRQDGAQEKNPVRNFLDDPRRSGAFAETDRREGSRRHVRNWGGADFEKVKTGMEQGKQWSPPGRGGARRHRGVPVVSPLDMTLSMTGRERAEYVRWKQEREQIDQERLARHRQPTGEWRREWDAQKMKDAFKEGAKPSGPGGGRHDEPRRPPKPPTFGQFLAEPQPERRRKGRGRGGGGRRGGGGAGPPKPYSMHDDRWEEQEEQPAAAEADRAPEQEEAGRAAAQQAGAPVSPSPREKEEEEEEDQWEDVSEGEEEEAEGSGSQGLSAEEPEEEEEGPGLPPRPPGRNGKLSLTMPAPDAETPSAEGKPLTPFSPAEGYCPVSDWGEEMELSSPRANPTKNPLAAPGEGPPLTAGTKPPIPPAEQGSPQAEGVTAPGPIAAGEEKEEEDPEVVTPGGGGEAAQEPGEPGAAMEQDPAAASGTVEITGFQREQTEEA